MTDQISKASPRLQARVAGVLYIIIIVAATFAELFVPSTLIASGDAAATAANILASEQLFRLGAAASLVTVPCDIALSLIFFELLKPVNRGLALLAAFFRLAAITVIAVNALTYLAPLTLLKGAPYLSAFTTDQLQALSMLSLKLHTLGFNISLLIFGVHCVLLGYLIARSIFLPRIIGVLLVLAGLCYATNSFSVFVFPAFAPHLFPYIMLPPFVAETSLALWLLVVGVNESRWREQAGAAFAERLQ